MSSTATPEIFTLASDQIDTAWPLVAPFVRRVLERVPEWDEDEVKDILKAREAQLWGVADSDGIRGVWITKIEGTARCKWGVVWLAAGDDIDAMVSRYLAHTEDWFREQGCQYAQIIGRKGWARMLPGYRPLATVMSKSL